MFSFSRAFISILILSLLTAFALAQIIFPVGNLEYPVGPSVPDLFHGDATYAYLIHPIDQGTCSECTIQLQNVRLMLDFEPHQVPVNFQVNGGLRTAMFDPELDLMVPDGWLYCGPTFEFEVTEPGPFVVEVETPNALWVDLDGFYFMTIRFQNSFEANLPADGMDEPGIVWFSPDEQQWFDMFGLKKTSGGKIIVWGDVLCGVSNPGTPVDPLPQQICLHPAHPNPFNPGTNVSFTLEEAEHVRLTIHDFRGRAIRMLLDEICRAGTEQVYWDGLDDRGQSVAAGLYLIRAESGGEIRTQKITIVK